MLATIATHRLSQASELLRKECETRSITVNALFEELLPEGQDQIPEESFCKHVAGLIGTAGFPEEHSTLLTRHLQNNNGGAS